MLRPGSLALTALLALLTGIGPLSVDMYLASWPDMARLLEASPAQVQLTISVYLVGFGTGQAIYGPVSDRHGRKPALLFAIGLFVLASVVCAVAPSIEVLIVARFFQALGGAGVLVLPRAVVRDLYEGVTIAREMSRMASVMALAPVFAPLIGGVLQTAFGWRSNFIALTAFGLALAVLVWYAAAGKPADASARAGLTGIDPALLRQHHPRWLFPRASRHRYLRLHRPVRVDLGGGVCAAAALRADATAIRHLVRDRRLRLSGRHVGGRARRHHASASTAPSAIGTCALALGGIGLGGWRWRRVWTRPCVDRALRTSLYLCGLGLVFPLTQAGALMPFPQRAGAASSLLGFVQQTSGAVGGAVVGHLMGADGMAAGGRSGAVPGRGALLVWALTRRMRAQEYKTERAAFAVSIRLGKTAPHIAERADRCPGSPTEQSVSNAWRSSRAHTTRTAPRSPRWLAVAAFVLLSGGAASAQTGGGGPGTARAQAVYAEWRRLPQTEVNCVDRLVAHAENQPLVRDPARHRSVRCCRRGAARELPRAGQNGGKHPGGNECITGDGRIRRTCGRQGRVR